MKTILVDDENIMLMQLEYEVSGIDSVEVVEKFCDPFDAIEYAEQHRDIELAFLDVGLPVMTGIELSKKLYEFIPDINIIFVSAFSDDNSKDAKEVMKHLVYKPYTRKTIEAEMKKAGLL